MSLARKIILSILGVIATISVGATVWGLQILANFEGHMDQTYQPRTTADAAEQRALVQATEPISILLLGTDQGAFGREDNLGRSDAMMVVTINPTKEQTTVVSLSRDIMANLQGSMDIPQTGINDKINHAYAFGGPEMAIETLNALLDINITYYASINMQGLADMVDAVGGIEVNNELGEFSVYDGPYGTTIVPAGLQMMNGDIALAYARMRNYDPDGDVGRQARQREIIEILVQRLISLDSLTNYQRIFEAVSQNMRTDLRFHTMIDILEGYHAAARNIQTFQLRGVSQLIDGVYYELVAQDDLLEIQNILRAQLGLPENHMINDWRTVTFESFTGLRAGFSVDLKTGHFRNGDEENEQEEMSGGENPVYWEEPAAEYEVGAW